MVAYFHTFKNSCDSLVSINAPVSQSDMFTFLVANLSSEYENFVTMLKLQQPKPTMAELRSSLLLHESWLKQIHPITMLMILYTNRVGTHPRTHLTHSIVVASLRSLRWSQALTRWIRTDNSSTGLGKVKIASGTESDAPSRLEKLGRVRVAISDPLGLPDRAGLLGHVMTAELLVTSPVGVLSVGWVSLQF
ncbi:hypothetical protein FXO38_25434 [Capsicum annuum]|nr:hypothetical protein FXO38_25434 [Capsicum annuum]KAF3636234.1 hypothetical protein FXO37_25530 [Capsicum annuum]